MKKKKQKTSRKTRTRTRKPKYLSLSKVKHIETSAAAAAATITKIPRLNHHQQLTLFPLHPENLVDDRSFADENVADLLFHSDSVPGHASLTALLTSAAAAASGEDQDESMSYGRVFDDNDNESLVRTAMKRSSSERDSTAEEEKWVCYSEVVEEATSATSSKGSDAATATVKMKMKRKKKKRKVVSETTSSLASEEGNSTTTSSSSLALKLDYQEILNAWSDKGSLYIEGPQTVPDLYDDHHSGLMDGWRSSVGNLWTVPESDGLKIKEQVEVEGKDGPKLGQREASVLRYKEKRQSRLFAKRIRYEVRKLNAEKRPRMKGRFVKII